MQQKLHHVVLGEELRYRADVRAAYFVAARVDGFFSAGLPELVDPTQPVIGAVGGYRNLRDETLQRVAVFGGEAELVDGVALG